MKNFSLKDPQVRRWIYGIVITAIPLLVTYGVLTVEEQGVWALLAGAVLGIGTSGLALPNTHSVEVAVENAVEAGVVVPVNEEYGN